MKIFLGCILIIICTCCGHFLSLKYVKRKTYYSDYRSFNKNLINEISFSQRSIKHIIQNEKNSDFYTYINNFINGNIRVESLNFLSQDEIAFINFYLDNIGSGDKITQLNYLKSVTDEIEKNYEINKTNEKKYRSLYIKISFLIGLILFVVII